MRRLALALGPLLLLLAAPSEGASVGQQWYTDAACTIPAPVGLGKTFTLRGYGKGDVVYYCPEDGADSADLVVLGNIATIVWRGSLGTPPGTVTLNVYADCVGASPPSTNCTDIFTGSASGYTQMDPSQPPSTVLTTGPGRYRWHPSASCSDCSLEVRGN
jgi:hypothetical protein